MLIEQEQTSYQNYAKKLQARLKWAYQKAQENKKKECYITFFKLEKDIS